MVLELLGIWIVAYVLTNLDDLLLLAAFFAHPNFRTRNVVAGEYLGVGTILAAALLGAEALAEAPIEWIGLLGFVPIAIGVRMALADDPTEAPAGDGNGESKRGVIRTAAGHTIGTDTYVVWVVTVANSADNFSVYLPLLAAQGFEATWLVVGVFAVMIGLWCLIGYGANEHPLVGRVLERYSERLLPYVLVGLGLFVLVETGAARTLFEATSLYGVQ